MKLIHKKDFAIACFLYLGALSITLFTNLSYLWATLLIYLSPSLFVFSRIKHNRKIVLLYTFIVGVLIGLMVELIATPGKGWIVQQLIPFRIFGYGYWEDIVWASAYTFWVITAYRHFIERDYELRLSKKVWGLLSVVIPGALVLGALGWLESLPELKYAYVWVGMIFVLPYFIFLLFTHRHLLAKSLPIFIFLALAAFAYELVALTVGNYQFAGNYLYAFNFNNHVLPLEDVILWMLLTSPVLIGIYDFFFEGRAA